MPICLRSSLLRLFVASTSLLSASALAAAPPSRIAVIGRSADTPLAHSVSSRALQAIDLGPAPANQQLAAITLHFSRSQAQQAALDQLLVNQQTPGSPQYRKWLTPLQFKAQFGMSDADIAKVSAWMTAQGFTVKTTSLTNTYLVASGTVAQAEKAFSVSMRSVSLNGEQHITNLSDPQLPAAVANVVTGITGLSNILPKARIVLHKGLAPKYTAADGSHFISPADYNTIYDLAPLKASAINGTGVTIAVMGQTAISLADVAAFRTAAGLSANAPQLSYNPTTLGVSDSGDLGEAQLDVEWAGAIAPNATIQYIATTTDNMEGGAFGSLLSAIGNTAEVAKIISISYGACEPEFSQSDIYAYDQYFQEGNAQGQTLIAPGGDSGATDCEIQEAAAADGLAVDFPGSSPHATSIGGTMFSEATGSYWNASNGTGGSSALSYIPETVWNEYASFGVLASGGGGRSIFFTKPSWQSGTGVPADAVRDVPDIALDAGANHDGFLICVSGSCTNGFADATGNYQVVGGTSVGVPSFAGILALVEQKIAQTGGLGNINPTLYGLAATSASSVYHDIVAGTNASVCAVGSPDCSSSTLLAGYSAAPGYDLASGWGSVDGNNLANQWAAAVPTPSLLTTGVNPSITSVGLASGAASCGTTGVVTFSVSLAPSTETTPVLTTTPTGTVQLFVDGLVIAGSSATLSNGSATLSLDTSTLASGSHKIAVAYSGDATFASSRGNLGPSLSPAPNSIYLPSTIDVVSATAPDFSLTPCLPTLAIASGGTGTVTLTATALNGFSGPVTFTASTDSQLGAEFAFSVSSATISASTPGSSVFTVNAFYKTPTSSLRPAIAPGAGPAGLNRRELYGTGAGTAALASLLFFVLPRRRRYIGLLALVVSVAAIGAAGCGSGATTIPASSVPVSAGTTNTAPGYYTINVTAAGNNSAGTPLAHTASLTLQVQ